MDGFAGDKFLVTVGGMKDALRGASRCVCADRAPRAGALDLLLPAQPQNCRIFFHLLAKSPSSVRRVSVEQGSFGSARSWGESNGVCFLGVK